MSVIFSRACEYAIQAVIYLAIKSDQHPVSIKEISDQLNIPTHFLGKILQNLTQDQLVASFKGPGGGFKLGKTAEEITLMQIVASIDGMELATRCVVGFPQCSETHPCPVHDYWRSIRNDIQKMLIQQTVAELVKSSKEKKRIPFLDAIKR